MDFVKKNKLNIDFLLKTIEKPEIFSPGEELFWNDSYISKNMLEAHLNPDLDAASKKHQIISRETLWFKEKLNLRSGMKVLDLGCGPGLYCEKFYEFGLDVVGVDYSRRSIEYARQSAKENKYNINYIYQNYLDIDYNNKFDVIFLIYYDFCALTDEEREQLLDKVRCALKDGGTFVFDLTTKYMKNEKEGKKWDVVEKEGFWKANPYLLLTQDLHYPERDVFLERYIIIEENGAISDYRNWHKYFSKKTIKNLLDKHGFQIDEIWGNFLGDKYKDTSQEMGIISSI